MRVWGRHTTGATSLGVAWPCLPDARAQISQEMVAWISFVPATSVWTMHDSVGAIWREIRVGVRPEILGTLWLKCGQSGDNFTLRNVMISYPRTLVVRSVAVPLVDRRIATAISVQRSVPFQ